MAVCRRATVMRFNLRLFKRSESHLHCNQRVPFWLAFEETRFQDSAAPFHAHEGVAYGSSISSCHHGSSALTDRLCIPLVPFWCLLDRPIPRSRIRLTYRVLRPVPRPGTGTTSLEPGLPRPVLEPGLIRKYLNQNPVIYRQFDKHKFRDLCKEQ